MWDRLNGGLVTARYQCRQKSKREAKLECGAPCRSCRRETCACDAPLEIGFYTPADSGTLGDRCKAYGRHVITRNGLLDRTLFRTQHDQVRTPGGAGRQR